MSKLAEIKKYSQLIKYLMAGLIIASLFAFTGIAELLGALSQITLPLLTLLLLISFLLVYLSVIKWGYFIEKFSAHISHYKLFQLYLIGYFVNLLLPSHFGGDALRSYKLASLFPDHEERKVHLAFAATLLERYTGIVSMMLLALLAIAISDDLPKSYILSVLAICLAVIALTCLALLDLSKLLPKRFKFIAHLEKLREAFLCVKGDKALIAKALAISLLYHLTTIANTISAAWAVGWWDVPFQELLVVIPLILLISAIPLAPGGLGIQEGAFFIFLQALGASEAQALGVALILRAKVYLLALIGGLFWLTERKQPERQVTSIY